MTKDIPYNNLPSCTGKDTRPTAARCSPQARHFKTGELLVFTAKRLRTLQGHSADGRRHQGTTGCRRAIALEDAAKGGKAACIVRVATVMKDKLTGVAADAFDTGKPLAGFDAHFSRQQIVPERSI